MKNQSNSKTEIQQRVGKVRAYLAGLGLPVSQTQAYEVAARVFGLENKHSLAAMLPKVTPADLCLSNTGRSMKGVKILQLTSTDGSDYDKFFLVPPHLELKSVKALFDAEITRLRERDRIYMEAGKEDYEYKDTDIIAFGESLGLTYVQSETGSQNWD